MYKVKTFRRDIEYDMADVDSKINKWLEKHPEINIKSHKITIQDEYLITQILYDNDDKLDSLLG